MTTLSTHDTKRSEDVRARLLVLAELPEEWRAAVGEWRRRAASHWPADVEADPAMEYLLFQTMVGAWPIEEERVRAYMEKATREAKRRTSWTDPDAAYDGAVRSYIAGIYDSGLAGEIGAFAERLVEPGRVVSLAQKLVQLMVPGVPDLYQGTELWDLSLVDPDNRRPVDFVARRAALDALEARSGSGDGVDPGAIMAGMDEGVPKLWVVREALRVRRAFAGAGPGAGKAAVIGNSADAVLGGYRGVEASGPAAEHVLAFARARDSVVVVVPRFPVRLVREGGWRGTVVPIPEGEWRNVLTGERMAGGDLEAEGLLARFPVALLVRESS
jgi:(1->4)-alpha-D-glucan 1-alpha-D-glucosylmutase